MLSASRGRCVRAAIPGSFSTTQSARLAPANFWLRVRRSVTIGYRYHHTKSTTSWTVETITLDHETRNKNSCTIVYFLYDNSENISGSLVVWYVHTLAGELIWRICCVNRRSRRGNSFGCHMFVIPFTYIVRFVIPIIRQFQTVHRSFPTVNTVTGFASCTSGRSLWLRFGLRSAGTVSRRMLQCLCDTRLSTRLCMRPHF